MSMLVALAATLLAAVVALRARRAVAGARAHRERYEALAGNLPGVSVLLYDRDLRFTLLEGTALQAHGWRRADIEGRLIADVVPEDRGEELLSHCRAALAGRPSRQDWTGIRGRGVSYRLHHVPLDRRGAMIVVRDVTDAVRLERERDADGRFLSAVLEQLWPDVMACDAEGTVRFHPGPARDPFDWPEALGLHTPDGEPLTGDALPLFAALQGDVVEGAELAVRLPDAAPRELVASARPVRDGTGALVGAVMSSADVTGMRAAERELRASQEHYRSVVERVGDAVFQTDWRGRWTFLDERFARWTGIPVEAALGRPARDFVHPDDAAAHQEAFAPLLLGGAESVRHRHRYLTAAGATRWIEVRAHAASDAAGRPVGVAGVMEDVTERHRTQQYEAAEQAVIDVLAAAPDAETAVPGLLTGLCRTLSWDCAELWTLDPDGERLRATDRAGDGRAGLEAFEAAADGRAFEIGDGLPGQAWARREPVWISALHDEPLFCRRAEAAATGVRSALAMPIAHGGAVLATIVFFSREEREPDPGLARLLPAIGAHLVQFIERRRLERLLAAPLAQVEHARA